MTLSRERGLAKTNEGVHLVRHHPSVGEHDVEISVVCAGICRTDLHVAAGVISAADGLILGHELAGRVARTGRSVRRVSTGDRVTVFPIIGCGTCRYCERAEPFHCATSEMLGVNRNGAFGDTLVVPERAVHRLPESVSFELGAYAEPIAASLAVTRAGLGRDSGRGAIFGRGRIAALTKRVLAASGVDVAIRDPRSVPPLLRSLDYVIETEATEAAFDAALSALRPGGTLVLKSRPATKVPFDVARAVALEVRIVAVAYAPIEAALALLASGQLDIRDLLGPAFGLSEHEAAFAAARRDERRKVFFRPEERA